MSKKQKYGKCQICLKYKKLTFDHVPPQGGIEIKPVEIKNALDLLTCRNQITKCHISQNGVKFKTICERCNNYWLGRKYDPVLNQFAHDVGKFLNSKLYFTDIVKISTKPNLLFRAILGHLLAAKNEVDDFGFDNDVRDLIFDENKLIPESINLFYWIYHYKVTIVIRDFIMPALRGKFSKFGYFNLIKYFPLAYLISDKNQYEGLFSLNNYKDCKPSEDVEIPIKLNFKKSWLWPEEPQPDNFIVMGKSYEDSVYAMEKEKKKN